MSLESNDGGHYLSKRSASDENVPRKKDAPSIFTHEKGGDNNCEEPPEEFWATFVKERYRSQIRSAYLDPQVKGKEQVSFQKNNKSGSSNYNNNNGIGCLITQTRDSEHQKRQRPVQYCLNEAACCENPELGWGNDCNGAKDRLWNTNQSSDTQSCCGGQAADNPKYRHSEACSSTTILPNKPEDRIHKPMMKRQDSLTLDVELKTTTKPLLENSNETLTYDEAGRVKIQNVGAVQKQQEVVKETQTPFLSVLEAQQQIRVGPGQPVSAQSCTAYSGTSFKPSILQLQARDEKSNGLRQQAPPRKKSSVQHDEAVTSNATLYGTSKSVSWDSSSQLSHGYSRYPNGNIKGAILSHDKIITVEKSTETFIFDIEKNDHLKTKQCRGCVVSGEKEDKSGSLRPVTGHEKLSIFLAALSFTVLILLSVMCVLCLQGRALQDRVQVLEDRVSAQAKQGCTCGQSGRPSSTRRSVNYTPRVYSTKHRAQTQHRDAIVSSSHAALHSPVFNKNPMVNVMPPEKPQDFQQTHDLTVDAEDTSEMLMSSEMWEVKGGGITPSFDQQKDKEEDDEEDSYFNEMDDLPDDSIHENLEGSDSSDDHFFADSPNSLKTSLALSRHVRSTDGNRQQEKDPGYSCKKLKNIAQRERGCNKQIRTQSFEAAFYDIFDYTKDLGPSECTNKTDKLWHNVSFRACRDAIITFLNKDTALPFYTTNKTNDRLLTQKENNPAIFEVTKAGLYLVHLNITIVDESGTHFLRIHLNDRAVLACQDGGFPCPHTNYPGYIKYRICNINGLLQLNEKDRLEIRTAAANTQLRMEKESWAYTKSYFKVVLLEAEK